MRPTVIVGEDPTDEMFSTEYFGPILAVHVFEDDRYDEVVGQMESVTPYALTGSIVAQDRSAITDAGQRLRYAAGNFYVNDKPTGAVVGQQPFGGARASGTNDKAGSAQNLQRWTSTRSIKENLRPADHAHLPAHGLSPDPVTGPRARPSPPAARRGSPRGSRAPARAPCGCRAAGPWP